MGLFGFGKNRDSESTANSTPVSAPASSAFNYTAEQYVATGHNMRAARKWAEAMECYKAAANMNNAEGLFWLGNCVLTGMGAVKNELLACQLFSLAARQNHQGAIDTLFKYLDAIMNDSVKNPNYDKYAALLPYLKLGAEAGHLRSIYMYGYFLTVGLGTSPNKQEAYKWLKIAADNGYALAQEDLKKYF